MKKKQPLYEYHPVPGVFSFQVNVPHAKYGACDYFIPKEMAIWLEEHQLRYSLCAEVTSGNGYTNGVTNKESHYIIRNAKEEDGLAFQIQFPFCKTHVSQQYDYR